MKKKIEIYIQQIQIDNIKRIYNNKFIICESEDFKFYNEINKMRF